MVNTRARKPRQGLIITSSAISVWPMA